MKVPEGAREGVREGFRDPCREGFLELVLVVGLECHALVTDSGGWSVLLRSWRILLRACE